MGAILAVISSVLGVLPSLASVLNVGKAIANGGTAVVVAIISAIPAVLGALVEFFKWVTAAPLNAFITAGVTFFAVGWFYGAASIADVRRDAIEQANKRADVAIEQIKKQYEERLRRR